MRAFIALSVPSWYADELGMFAHELSRRIQGRFLAPHTYHLTLAFLGNVPEPVLDGTMDVLDHAARQSFALPLEPTELGCFGPKDDATLWLGFRKTDALMELAHTVREALEIRGIPFDAKPFVPHLTLARRADLSCGDLGTTALPPRCMACRIALMKSTLGPEGACYDEVYGQDLPGLPR